MSTLLRDLIHIPEAVQKGDFVMSLADGVSHAERTLDGYVVTEQLGEAFENAMTFIGSAVRDSKSKAAYLDGSFGAGKSHFMAVLHLLLQGNAHARSIPELAPAVEASRKDLDGKTFELVPFHMIGAESMEQAILGGYVEHLRRIDPDAPLPGVYADEPIFAQADHERGQLGDEAFFARLGGDDEGWGTLGGWSAAEYEQARAAPADDPRRRQLSGELVDAFLPGLRDAMRGNSTGYVDIDTGLAELARHAEARGASALILFLDELILWLGSRIADTAFVTREGQKLIKLIEFTSQRPIPVVSIVARQRDLRDFVGDQVLGAERFAFADALKHWEGRFHRITLTDGNLPKIAEKRLLRPVSDQARQQLDAAFQQTERERPEVLEVLLTEDGDKQLFRSTYPFSPAFMKTLIAASSVLQRERTSLKVMLQLLVDRRDDLTVGDLVSVGELYDVLAQGDEPFADDLKRQFQIAQTLYERRFRPRLLADHNVSESQAAALPRAHGFRADDRVVKTLLLAALVPRTGPLNTLTVARLAALNHGSFRSPIPGGEKGVLLRKLRAWSAEIGELKVGDDQQNPTVAVRLTGVDTDTVIQRAASVDNAGERRRLVRRLVLEEFGVRDDNQLFLQHQFIWRGTRRRADVAFGNIRDTVDLPDDALAAQGNDWKVIVDYPFDPGHSPTEDLDRLERWRAARGDSRTVCWVPAFFSSGVQTQLGRLVVVEHVLQGERLDDYGDHLSVQDRAVARGLLADLQSSLRATLLGAVRQAYGVERAGDAVDASHGIDQRLQPLRDGMTLQVPVGASMADAFSGLVKQLLDAQYPKHPLFEVEVRPRDLKVVLEEVLGAVDSPNGRIEVPADRRKVMKRLAEPLRLGHQHDSPFILSDHWREHLSRAIGRRREQGETAVTVGDLRRAIDEPEPLGLHKPEQNLILILFAEQTGQAFSYRGAPVQPTIERMDDESELVLANLPSQEDWDVARTRAAEVFGVAAQNPARNPTSVETLATGIRNKVDAARGPAGQLVQVLGERMRAVGLNPPETVRWQQAQRGAALVESVASTPNAVALIEALGRGDVGDSGQQLGTSIAQAGAVVTALENDRWNVIAQVAIPRASADDAGAPFVEVIADLRQALERPEFAVAIAPAVAQANQRTLELIATPTTPPPSGPPVVEPPVPGGPGDDGPGSEGPPVDRPHVVTDRAEGLGLDEARGRLEALRTAHGGDTVSVDLVWRITTTDPRTS